MTVEVLVASISAGFTTLFGGGMFATYISSVKKKAVDEHRLQELEDKLHELDSTVTRLDRDGGQIELKLEMFEKALANLDRIPDIAAKLDATVSAVSRLQEVVDDLAARRHE